MENIREKIIVVDDMSYFLSGIKYELEKYYEVFPATSVEKMFQILKNITPDMILLDVNMPGVSGYEAIKILKADADYADIPVIFLTSQNDKASENKGLSLGAAAYVSKPFTPSLLLKTIKDQLEAPRPSKDDFVFDFGEAEAQEEIFHIKRLQKKILCVDDMVFTLMSVKKILGERYDVFTAQSVSKMFQILENVRPDVVLLDINMPGMNGYDIFEKLKADANYSKIPIVFITALTDRESVMKGVAMGAAGYISKPIDYSLLIERIEQVMSKSTGGS
ncbi:MAG: response regulator [Chitinivibrionia bacterium]|nr:response regulator [Chitinivibrionia bacterium]